VFSETLCAIGFIASLFSACAPSKPAAIGYIEGEYVLLAPIEIARIKTVDRRRGDRLKPGDVVATLESFDVETAVRDAEARLGQAQAELANLEGGRRPEEISVIDATLRAAEAQARDANRVLARRRDLSGRGVTTQVDLDAALTANDVAAARVGEISANLAVARLPARPQEILSAENRVRQSQAALDQARWRLSQRTIVATTEGQVADIIRRPGEIAAPTAPVVSLLPDGAIKLKMFVPERLLSSLAIGQPLNMRCDGCLTDTIAIVSYIAPEPEFTPPVIYSLDSRQKLVFLVEARPSGEASKRLQPGQIVDVLLPGDAR
jgi:HlyD family secretion protein